MIYKKKKGRITLGSIAFNAANLKLVTINSKSSDIVRRTVFGSLAVVMVLTNLAFLTYFLPESVSAAEATVLPNTDVANAWGSTGGTSDSSCAGGTFCDFVDEDVQGTPDTTNYVNTGSQTGIGEVTEEYGMTTVSNVSSATSITIDIEAQSSTNANGGTLDNINIDLRIGGS